MFLAKALFDNVAEAPDELAFRRGDVITVISLNACAGTGAPGGGWWLCSFRGRQGIAPGNRLKILSGIAGEKGEGEDISDLPLKDDAGGRIADWKTNLEKSVDKEEVVVAKGQDNQFNSCLQISDSPPSPCSLSRMEPSPPPDDKLYDTPITLPTVSSSSFYDNLTPLSAVANNTSNALYSTPTKVSTAPKSTITSLYYTASSTKQAAAERSLRVSLDSLSSTSSQSVPLSADQHDPPLYQIPMRSVARRTNRLSGGDSDTMGPAKSEGFRLSGVEHEGTKHYQSSSLGSKQDSLGRFVSDGEPVYDTPVCSQSLVVTGDDVYDIPSPDSQRQSHVSVETASRDSMLSSASTDSCFSGSSSLLASSPQSSAASMSDTARCGLDPSPHEPSRFPTRKSHVSKQPSLDSGCEGLYDTPGFSSQIPTFLTSLSFVASSTHLTDLDNGDQSQVDIKRSHSLEHTEGVSCDFPRRNSSENDLKTAVPCSAFTSAVGGAGAVYDVPLQAAQLATLSASSDFSDTGSKLLCCSTDSCMSGADYCLSTEGDYEELNMDLDSAVELLMKLQEDVTKSVSRLFMFVSSTWRTREFLQSNMSDIKSVCMELKKAMSDFLDFAQRTLANSAHVSDRKLVNRLGKQVSHLQQQFNAVSAALHSLEAIEWQVTLLAEPLDPNQQDHLDDIISLAKDLTPDIKTLVSLIQGNSILLFKRSSVTPQSCQSKTVRDKSKPRIAPKPQIQKLGEYKRRGMGVAIPASKSVQQTPLSTSPAPVSGKLVSTVSVQRTLHGVEMKKSQDSLYDYVNVMEEGMYRCTMAEDKSDRDCSDLQEDYDYVQLLPGDFVAQQKSKEQQQQVEYAQILKIKDNAVELSNIPTSVKSKCSGASDPRSEEDKRTKPTAEFVHHTDVMFADLGEVHQNTGMEQTSEDIKETYATPKRKGMSTGLLNPELGSKENPKDPMYSMNCLAMSNHSALSSSIVGVTNRPVNFKDKQVLCYYSEQLETQFKVLTNAIDTFFTSVRNKDHPKTFIANIKCITATGSKLVYVGDAVYRSVANKDVRDKVLCCASHLCDCLKLLVQTTKSAALQFPSVSAAQSVVRCVVRVSHAARDLRLVITQAATF